MRYGELSRRKEPNPTGLFDGEYKSAADASVTLPDNQRHNPLGYKPPSSTAAPAKASGGYGGTTANKNQPYIDQLNSLYDQIMGRGKFQYDLNGDMLYRQMADQYTQLGRQAMRDATGTAAGLTGGYGNSWANHVGNQAYQQYLTQLNNNIPDLYDRAYNAWLNEGNELLQKYEMAANHGALIDSLQPRQVVRKASGDKEAAATAGASPQTAQGIWETLVRANGGNQAPLPLNGSSESNGVTFEWNYPMGEPFAGYYQEVYDELKKKK